VRAGPANSCRNLLIDGGAHEPSRGQLLPPALRSIRCWHPYYNVEATRTNRSSTWTVTNQPAGEFAGLASSPGVKVVTGDFSGNGRTDIALTGVAGWQSIAVAFSNGDGT